MTTMVRANGETEGLLQVPDNKGGTLVLYPY